MDDGGGEDEGEDEGEGECERGIGSAVVEGGGEGEEEENDAADDDGNEVTPISEGLGLNDCRGGSCIICSRG